jgi:hypothetical protein
MQARTVLLTHFSQRYGEIPLVQPDDNNRFAIAYDHMEFRFVISCALLYFLSFKSPKARLQFAITSDAMFENV